MARTPRPAPPTTCYRAWLRGKLAQAGLLSDAEAKLYSDPSLPTPQLVAFVLGSTSNPDSPLLSEVEVGVRLAALMAPAIPARAAESMAERAYKLIDPADLSIKITADSVVIEGRPMPHVQLDPEAAFRQVCHGPDAGGTDPDQLPRVVVPVAEAQVGT